MKFTIDNTLNQAQLWESPMKLVFIAILGFVMAGCASSQRSASLTKEQATTKGVQLANDKANAIFHCQPFIDGKPAQFVAGHWVWTDKAAYGQMDLEVTVTLAANSSTNQVNLRMLDNMNIISFRPNTTTGVP